jgi:hypothetical protein
MRSGLLLPAGLPLFALALAGCPSGGSSDATPPAPAPAPAEAPAPEPEAAAPAGPPPGDTCASPIEATFTDGVFTTAGTLTGFTNTLDDRIEQTGYSWTGHEIFYAMDIPAGTRVEVTLDDKGEFDGGVYVLTDCANPVQSVFTGLDTTATTPHSYVSPGGRQILVVDSWMGATTGTYNLTVRTTTPNGQGDACTNPIPLPFVGNTATFNGTLAGFSNTIDDTIAVTGYSWTGHDIFFTFEAAQGESFTFTLDDKGEFDGGLYLLTDCGNPVGSVVGGLDTTPTRPLSWAAPAAGRYVLVVDAWMGATQGNYTLTVQKGA